MTQSIRCGGPWTLAIHPKKRSSAKKCGRGSKRISRTISVAVERRISPPERWERQKAWHKKMYERLIALCQRSTAAVRLGYRTSLQRELARPSIVWRQHERRHAPRSHPHAVGTEEQKQRYLPKICPRMNSGVRATRSRAQARILPRSRHAG